MKTMTRLLTCAVAATMSMEVAEAAISLQEILDVPGLTSDAGRNARYAGVDTPIAELRY